jgi:hypothetical protein
MILGLRTYFGYEIKNIPPNFMEFNMYVSDMSSPQHGKKTSDIYFSTDGNIYIYRS